MQVEVSKIPPTNEFQQPDEMRGLDGNVGYRPSMPVGPEVARAPEQLKPLATLREHRALVLRLELAYGGLPKLPGFLRMLATLKRDGVATDGADAGLLASRFSRSYKMEPPIDAAHVSASFRSLQERFGVRLVAPGPQQGRLKLKNWRFIESEFGDRLERQGFFTSINPLHRGRRSAESISVFRRIALTVGMQSSVWHYLDAIGEECKLGSKTEKSGGIALARLQDIVLERGLTADRQISTSSLANTLSGLDRRVLTIHGEPLFKARVGARNGMLWRFNRLGTKSYREGGFNINQIIGGCEIGETGMAITTINPGDSSATLGAYLLSDPAQR